MTAKTISFVTTCMNRVHHLMQTLPRNIEAASGFPVEFILLNYNSSDNMDEWMRQQWMSHIESGLIKYVRTDKPSFFYQSHAKNVGAMLTSGEIICNLDADNFISAEYVSHAANIAPGTFLHVKPFIPGTSGRIAMFRRDFFSLRGYNESFQGWGFEDDDLRQRARIMGLTMDWVNTSPAEVILHSDEERLAHMTPQARNKVNSLTYNQAMSRIMIMEGFISTNPNGWGRELVW